MKRSINSSIRINSSAELILQAFIDPVQLKQWWGVQKSYIQPKAGGTYVLIWLHSDEGIKFIQTSKIGLINKRSQLQLEDVLFINSEKGIFGPYSIKIEVQSLSNHSIVTITQNGFEKRMDDDWYFELMSKSWPEVLLFLKQHLES